MVITIYSGTYRP